MKAYDPLLEKIKKEVKMSENLEQETPELKPQSQPSPREVLHEVLTNSLKPLNDKVEQLQSDFDEFQTELKHQSAEEFVQAFEANEIKDNELAERIFSAIREAGYNIVLKEPIVEAEAIEESETKEAELEEPDVVAGKRDGYRYLPIFNISIKE